MTLSDPISYMAHIEIAEECPDSDGAQITVIHKRYSARDGHEAARMAEREYPDNCLVSLSCWCKGVRVGAQM